MKHPETLAIIEERRSIRKYTAKPLRPEEIDALLRAGFYAPSSKGRFPTHFVAVTEQETREKLSELLPYAKMARSAPAAILVCGDTHVSWDKWRDDCAAACSSILLAAEAMGLGACWCAAYPRPEVVDGLIRLLKLPAGVLPFALIPVGHPGERKPRPERVVPERIHRERW